jgi:hypothetical protein
MSNSNVLEVFNSLFTLFNERYGDKWTDGTKSHYQQTARVWIPVIAKELTDSHIKASVASLKGNKNLFKKAPPSLDEFIDFSKHHDQGGYKETKQRYEDPFEQNVHEVLMQSSFDYSSFNYRGIDDPTIHASLISAWVRRLKEFNVKSPEAIKKAYTVFVSKPGNSEFPPKLIELVHIASELENQSVDIDPNLYAAMQKLYESLLIRYGKRFAGEVDEKIVISEWMETLVAYNVNDVSKLRDAIKETKTSMRFATFAPKILDITEAYYLQSSDIPNSDIAFQMAVGNIPGEIHPIVSITRREIGPSLLMRTDSPYIKNDFLKKYRENCIKHAQGLIAIDDHQPETVIPDKGMDKKSASAVISKLLNKTK